MKFRYIAHIRLPTEKAHGIQIMQMCSAFAKAGADVELVIPTRASHIDADPFEYYGVERNFTIRKLRTLAPHNTPFWPLTWLTYTAARISFARRVIEDATRNPADFYYVRDEIAFRALGNHGIRAVWEIHDMPRNMPLYARAMRLAPFLVAITGGLKRALIGNGIDAKKVFVEADGVDMARFSHTNSRDVRSELGLQSTDVLVTYVGSLYAWKGVPTLIDAAARLPTPAYLLIVGGTGDELENIRSMMAALEIRGKAIGHVPPSDAPSYVQAADIIVIPNSAKEKISVSYTSPLKLFEALAAGKAIVASDLPSLREVLDDTCAQFFTPDDPVSLSAAITSLVSDREQRRRLGVSGLARARYFDWTERAKRILALFKKSWENPTL